MFVYSIIKRSGAVPIPISGDGRGFRGADGSFAYYDRG